MGRATYHTDAYDALEAHSRATTWEGRISLTAYRVTVAAHLPRIWPLVVIAAIVAAACTNATTPSPQPSAAQSGSAAPGASGTGALGSPGRPIVMAFAPSAETALSTAKGKAITLPIQTATGLTWNAVVRTSYAATLDDLCAGQIDVAWLNALTYLLASQKNCADLMLTTLRNDETGKPISTSQSQIIVRSDSGIGAVSDLKGKKFAFTDQLSTSGSLFPSLKIKQDTGQDPKAFFSQIVYAGTQDASVLAVYQGSVDGSASCVDARNQVAKEFPDIMQKTKRIATAGPVPNDTVVVRKGFPADLRSKVQSALLDYAKTDAGKKALKDLYAIDGLAVGDPTAYDPILKAVTAVGLGVPDLDKAAQATAKPAPPGSVQAASGCP